MAYRDPRRGNGSGPFGGPPRDPRHQSPFNALPPVVVGLALAIAAVEAMFQAASAGLLGGAAGVGWRLEAIRDWGVAPVVWEWMLENRAFPPELLARFVTYPFLHSGFTHAAFVCVFVLALGNVCAPAFPRWRPLVLFFVPAIAGALAYVILYPGAAPLFGGYPGAYGLIGAFTLLVRRGLTRVPPDRAFLLIGLLLAIQPVFGLAAGAGFAWLPDWTAELVGAAAGYGLAAFLLDGGPRGLRDRMRRR